MKIIKTYEDRNLTLTALHQDQVGRMLEGHLSKIFIDSIEQYAIRKAEDLFDCTTPYLFQYPKSNNSWEEYAPKTQCIARFESNVIQQKKLQYDYSEGVIIWFQDHFALPIQADILEQIQKLNWNKIGTNYEF